MANYQIYQEGGTYYLAVRTERNGEPNIWTQFNYLYVNPVTPKVVTETQTDPDTGEESEVEVEVFSKLAMRPEPVKFLRSGGSKVVRVIDGKDYWLIKMPEDFIIDQGYQPGVDKPEAEQFNIGGSTTDRVPGSRGGTVLETRDILPFIAKRAFDYAEEFEVPANPRGGRPNPVLAADIRERWARKVAELMAVKY